MVELGKCLVDLTVSYLTLSGYNLESCMIFFNNILESLLSYVPSFYHFYIARCWIKLSFEFEFGVDLILKRVEILKFTM